MDDALHPDEPGPWVGNVADDEDGAEEVARLHEHAAETANDLAFVAQVSDDDLDELLAEVPSDREELGSDHDVTRLDVADLDDTAPDDTDLDDTAPDDTDLDDTDLDDTDLDDTDLDDTDLDDTDLDDTAPDDTDPGASDAEIDDLADFDLDDLAQMLEHDSGGVVAVSVDAQADDETWMVVADSEHEAPVDEELPRADADSRDGVDEPVADELVAREPLAGEPATWSPDWMDGAEHELTTASAPPAEDEHDARATEAAGTDDLLAALGPEPTRPDAAPAPEAAADDTVQDEPAPGPPSFTDPSDLPPPVVEPGGAVEEIDLGFFVAHGAPRRSGGLLARFRP